MTPAAATEAAATEGLLRALAPQVLGAVVRRYGHFADAEDAVQEALLAASTAWPVDGVPDRPLAWLVRVASRRMADRYRADEARRRREDLAASWSAAGAEPSPGRDDTLVLMFLCCHPSLTPGAAIPLTLRAVGGLTTREIAAAFLVPEATMAQRISRAKATLRARDEPFALPPAGARPERLQAVLHVLYLLFNEGYTTSAGPDLARTDLSGEAVRLAREVRAALPTDPEVAGLLALMLLTDARRPARTGTGGELVPLADQDRSRWDQGLVGEGVALVTEALGRGRSGEYQLQAAIAAVHSQAARHADTDWPTIVALYGRLEQLTGNPMVTLNRAVALAMADGPEAGLAGLVGLDGRLGDHHRLHAVRAHLHELAGDRGAAVAGFRAAAARATNQREREYLTLKAARLGTSVAPVTTRDEPEGGGRRQLTQGQLAYLQIPAVDVAASGAFYAGVFGWRVDGTHPGFDAPGLIGQWVTDRPAAPDGGLLAWLHVDDMAAALDAVRAHGGEVVAVPAPDGPRVLATVRDPAGNPIGLAQHGR